MIPGRPRLLVLRALKLGDFLTGLPALRALARAFPDHERILAAPRRFSAVAGQGDMDRVLDTPGLMGLPPSGHGADVAVDLHGRGPASQRVLLDASPGRLISFRSAAGPETASGPVWLPHEHEVHRWCRLLSESGIPADPTDLLLRPPLTGGRPAGPRPTIIHPGAASPARRWPPERFAAVARAEAAAGRTVLITGGPAERDLALGVARAADLPGRAVIAGRTSLLDLIRLVDRAGRVICGDTGVAHVATATGTPSVVLFGPVPPAEWGPPPIPRHIALWAGTRGDPHGSTCDPGLSRIDVATVLRALATLDDLPEAHVA